MKKEGPPAKLARSRAMSKTRQQEITMGLAAEQPPKNRELLLSTLLADVQAGFATPTERTRLMTVSTLFNGITKRLAGNSTPSPPPLQAFILCALSNHNLSHLLP